MSRGSNANYQNWLRKRKLTMIAFTVESLFLGIEYSVTFLTLWLYLKTLVKSDVPKVFYSSISACYLLSSVLFALITGRLADRYRNVRVMFFIANTMVIVGNIIYALPFSPWLLVIGRLISGGAGPLRAVISGEIARCYPRNEVTSKLSIIGMAFSFGFIIGPGVNFAFYTTNVWIYSWHITYVNVPGIYMATLFILVQVMCMVMLSNISKEYDLKEEMSKDESEFKNDLTVTSTDTTDVEQAPFLETDKANFPTIKSVFKALFGSYDTTLLLVLSFFSMYFTVTFDMWLPLLIVDKLHWGIIGLNSVVLYAGICASIILFILIWKKLPDAQMYLLAVFSFFAFSVIIAAMLVLRYYNKNMALDIALWAVDGLAFGICEIAEEIFLIACLAKMVSSNVQVFAEGIRLTFSRLGAVAALLTSAFLFDWLEIVGFIHIGISWTLVALLIIRKAHLANPRLFVNFQ